MEPLFEGKRQLVAQTRFLTVGGGAEYLSSGLLRSAYAFCGCITEG
ncbi:MAG: hypothetical protein MZV63_31025 [Marinilabiliales bacterium]|nr:hypothetical protein [Marinilabiliales bacterium]